MPKKNDFFRMREGRFILWNWCSFLHLWGSASCISTMATRAVQMVQPISRRRWWSKITSFLNQSSLSLIISTNLLVSPFFVPPCPFQLPFSQASHCASRMGSMRWPFLNSLVSVLELTLCRALKGCLNSPPAKVLEILKLGLFFWM